jgi:branched-chain amino acid transport system substrate-binding protein
MTQKRKQLSVAVVCSLVLVLALLPFSKSFAEDAQVFKFGMITSVTGQMAPAFRSLFEAAKPAEDLFNQRGGITVNGQKYTIKIVTEDDQSSPSGGIAAINRMIQNNVKFIYAPQFMVTNLAIAPLAEEAKILRIKGLGVGTEEVGPKLRYSFYTSAQTYNVSPNYNYLVRHYPKVKKIALISPDDPGAKSLREVTRKEAKKRGIEIVFEEAFKLGSEDFYPTLTRALAKKPDAIDMVISIAPWSAAVINQSRELGFKGPIFSTIFADIAVLNTMVTPKYAYDIFHAQPDVSSPKMTPLIKEYRAIVERQIKSTPFNTDHMLVVEALYPLLQAIQEAQSFDTTKVAATIENMKKVDTIYGPGRVTGKNEFGINHVIRTGVTPMSRIMNGKIEFEFVEK